MIVRKSNDFSTQITKVPFGKESLVSKRKSYYQLEREVKGIREQEREKLKQQTMSREISLESHPDIHVNLVKQA